MPECDDITVSNHELGFDQPWLNFTVPPDSVPIKEVDGCVRYAPINAAQPNGVGQCTTDSFNTTHLIECTEFVYATDERNIQTEVLPTQTKYLTPFLFQLISLDIIIFSSIYNVRIAISWR